MATARIAIEDPGALGTWSIPASWYTSPAIAELERERVFWASWAYACHRDDVARPGDYAAGIAGDLPWVLVRDDGGTLRAFANVCRHKASTICDGKGSLARLTCPYHGWQYRLDGSLASAPRSAGMIGQDVAIEALALPRLGLWEFGPFYFVHRHPDAGPPPLGPLAERLWAEPTTGFVGHPGRTWDMRCNWKVFIDNYLDGGYHIPVAHPSLDAQLTMGAYRTEVYPTWSLQTAPPATSADPLTRARIGKGALYAWLWPNVMFNRYGPVIDVNIVVPTGPETCRVTFGFWFDHGALADPAAFIAKSVAQSAVTQDEDVTICERVQRGISSGTWPRGPLAPQVEGAIAGFQGELAKVVTVQV